MSYDFLNPFVNARIWTPKGESIDLTLIGGGDDKPPVGSVELVVEKAGVSSIKIDFILTYSMAIQMIDESPWIRIGNSIAVKWGYNDGNPAHVSDWMYGFMVNPPEIGMGEEVTVSVSYTLQTIAYSLESARVWGTNKTPISLETIYGMICKKYGLELVDMVKKEKKDHVDPQWTTPKAFIQGRDTDFEFIMRHNKTLNPKREMMIKGKQLVLFNSLETKVIPTAEFHMYGKLDTDNNIYPMLGFNTESWGPYFIPKRLVTAIWDDPNKAPPQEAKIIGVDGAAKAGANASTAAHISGAATMNTSHMPMVVNDEGLNFFSEADLSLADGKQIPVLIRPEEAESAIRGALEGVASEDASDYGILVTVETVGIPTLFLDQLIRLRGVTKFFSTIYSISKMTTTINDSGASLSMDCMAKGFDPEVTAWAELVNNNPQAEETQAETEEAEATSSEDA